MNFRYECILEKYTEEINHRRKDKFHQCLIIQ